MASLLRTGTSRAVAGPLFSLPLSFGERLGGASCVPSPAEGVCHGLCHGCRGRSEAQSSRGVPRSHAPHGQVRVQTHLFLSLLVSYSRTSRCRSGPGPLGRTWPLLRRTQGSGNAVALVEPHPEPASLIRSPSCPSRCSPAPPASAELPSEASWQRWAPWAVPTWPWAPRRGGRLRARA